jgi:hypothetical protein
MSTSSNHKRRAAAPTPLIVILILGGILATALIAMATQGRPGSAQSTPHFVNVPPATDRLQSPLRTVVVAGSGERLPHMSETEGLLMTSLVTGQLPNGATHATVRTDSNCQPDQQGVSHCLNELEIGSTIVMVRHHHKMSEVPCLTPGETVNIVRLEQYKKL